MIRYVRTVANGGDNTTGDGSTGAPYATIGKAILDTPNIIYLGAGTFSPKVAGAIIPSDEWCIVQPEAGESAATVNVEVESGANSVKHERLMFKDVLENL